MAKIEFALFAPYNKAAELTGDFSAWRAVPMTPGDDGYFRAQVELDDGVYSYKFRVRSKSWFVEEDSWVDVVDPYAFAIQDDENQNGVVRVVNGRRVVDSYSWQHDDALLPADHELVIYELHVGDFSGGEDDPFTRGKFVDVVAKLDYLAELGVNALEFMPLKEYPGTFSWGYNPRHYFAIESGYGFTDDFKRLVDACHARGMRVLIDSVYNHSESSAPLTQIDHDYWYHHAPRDRDNNWGPEFNFDKYDETLDVYPARKFIGDVVRFWVSEYHIDGIRFDAARQIANHDFMHWITQEAKRAAGSKPFYTIAEHIPESPTITGPDGPMDGCWHDSFYHTLKAHLTGDVFDLERLKDALDARRQGFLNVTNVVNYLANHDHHHLMAELGAAGMVGEAAFKRARLGAALLFTAFGVPLVWMGQEFGEYKHTIPEENKIDWTLLRHDRNRALLETYKGLTHLRRTHRALREGNLEFFFEDLNARVFAYVRWHPEGGRVVTVANFSGNHLDYTVPNFPEDGHWHEWLGDYELEAQGGQLRLELPAYEAKVLVR